MLPNWLQQNFRVKAGLFILAVLLWFLVVTERTFEYAFELPVVPVNVKEGKVIAQEYVRYALVKFEADGKDLLRMQFIKKPFLELNLSTINYFFTFNLKPEMVIIPSGINANILDIVFPDSIKIILDSYHQTKVKIEPQASLDAAAGFTIPYGIILDPDSVNISGPEKDISEVSAIKTEKIDLDDLSRDVEIQLDLETPDIFGINMSHSETMGYIDVERIGERKLIGIPIEARNTPNDRVVLIEPGSVDIKISGAVSYISKLEKKDFNAWIDFRDFSPRRSNRAPVRITTGKEIDIVELKPTDVRIIVRRN